MERLPLELVWLVYEHLEEYDLAPTPYSEFTEEPCNQLVHGDAFTRRRRRHNSSWIRLSEASRANIRNARLASSVFHDTSHKTFAKLLADRTFRLTGVGLQDLVAISRKKELIQHLTTLTLGCAAFRRNMGINDSGFVWPCTFLSGLKMEDRSRLAVSYVKCRDWQHDNMESHTKTLASIFQSLRNLDSIRMLTVDPVFHLGGWLKPGDEDLIIKDHTLFQDRSSEVLIQHYHRNTHPRMYTNESAIIKDCIIDAIKLSSLKLRDFRATPKPVVYDLNISPLVTPALQTLRIVLTEGNMERLILSDFFETVIGLRDLSLTLEDGNSHRNEMGPMVESMVTARLLRRLEEQPHLRRLELSGDWIIDGEDLVRFVTSRVETLRCLILNETKIISNWDPTLRSIARVTSGRTMFLKLWLPGDFKGNRQVPSGTDWEASIGFSHPFVWVTEA